jgi:hypothetical protein
MRRGELESVIKVSYAFLGEGETDRKGKCPACSHGGGDFSISRDDSGLLYRCFRIKCGVQGRIASIPATGLYGAYRDIKVKKPFNPFRGDTCFLSGEQEQFFYDKFLLTPEDIKKNRIVWAPELTRYIFPIFTKQRKVIGNVARSYMKGTRTKTINYWEDTDEVHVHYPPTKIKSNQVILVEDTLSAIRLAKHVPTIALLGTNIPKALIPDIAKKDVYLALDDDALGKALELIQRFRVLFRSMNIIMVDKDPKNLTEDELIEQIIEEMV